MLDIRSAGQEIPTCLWNPSVSYRVQDSPLLDCFLNQYNPVQTLITLTLHTVLTVFSNLHLDLSSGHFPFTLSDKTFYRIFHLYAYYVSYPSRPLLLTHLNNIWLSHFHLSVSFPLLDTNIIFGSSFSNTLTLYIP
jgi:hypothetical protein